MARGIVLVASADDDMLFVLCAGLQAIGHQVVAERAVPFLPEIVRPNGHVCDAIVIDARHANDLTAVVARYAAAFPLSRVIVLSGNTDDECAVLGAGADVFLLKPVPLEQIEAALGRDPLTTPRVH